MLFMMLLPMAWNCKEKPEQKEPNQKIAVAKKNSRALKDLASFAGISLSDTTDVQSLMSFKEMDENGVVLNSDQDNIQKLFKALEDPNPTKTLPIVEIKNTDLVILAVNGKGFSGSIWTKLLVNRGTLEIEKIQFEHKSESEGYGSEITKKSFEEQFLGIVIDPDSNTFGLSQGGVTSPGGKRLVDGIAGATVTSKRVVDMLNVGLQKYRNYLRP